MDIPNNLSIIAGIIERDWKNVYFGARPYLDAMYHLTGIEENYYEDSARSVVTYFLANAHTWHGEVARNVKARLNELFQ